MINDPVSLLNNTDLFTEIKYMQAFMEEIIEKHTDYYDKGECYFADEISGIADYLGLLEKEWIKRYDSLIFSAYANVNQSFH